MSLWEQMVEMASGEMCKCLAPHLVQECHSGSRPHRITSKRGKWQLAPLTSRSSTVTNHCLVCVAYPSGCQLCRPRTVSRAPQHEKYSGKNIVTFFFYLCSRVIVFVALSSLAPMLFFFLSFLWLRSESRCGIAQLMLVLISEFLGDGDARRNVPQKILMISTS